MYLLPFDGDESNDQEILSTMNCTKICCHALMKLLRLKKDGWFSLSRLAKTTGMAKTHGNKGKSNRGFKPNSQSLKDVHKAFDELIDLGEVQATRTVVNITGE